MILISALLLFNAAFFVWTFFCITPFWDAWNWVSDYQLYAENHYTWQDLLKPHNEHRIVTTRLLLFVDALWFHMTGRFAVVVNFALLGVIGWIVARLIVPPRSSFLVRATYALSAMAWMLSLAQWFNLLEAFQVQVTLLCLGILMASVALVGATSERWRGVHEPRHGGRAFQANPGTWLAIGAGLFYAIAAFSMAGGLLALPSLVLLLALRRSTFRVTGAFLISAILAAALFLFHYQAAHAMPLMLPVNLPAILALAQFFAQFLGNAFSGCPGVPLIAGLAGVSVYILALAGLVRRRYLTKTATPGRASALLASAGAIMTIAASAAVARSSGGTQGSLEPRYATMSLLFLACVVGTAWHLYRRRPLGGVWAARLQAVAAALLIAAMAACNFPPQFRRGAIFHANGLRSEGQSMRRNVFVPQLFTRVFYGRPPELASRLRFLQQHHLSVFAPTAERRPPANLLALAQSAAVRAEPCAGEIDYAYREDATRFVISGILASPQSRRSADWIAVISDAGTLLDVLPATYSRKLSATPGHKGRAGFGFWSGFTASPPGGRQELGLSAIGIFAGAQPALCRYGKVIDIGPFRVQTLDSLGDFRVAAVETAFQPAGTFRLNGVAPMYLQAAPLRGEALFASAAAGDAAKGTMIITVRENGSDDIAMPFTTGPVPRGQSIEVQFRDGSTALLPVPGDTSDLEWRVATLPFKEIAQHGGWPIKLIVRDDGDGWGQWLAVGTPVFTKLDPDWAKLF
jgi:hypothetical protein